MRLYYFGRGERRYAEQPVRVYPRPYWEFQAVIRGRIGPVYDGGPGAYRERSLWIFEPECRHGWTGPEGEVSEVIVFHLPPPDSLLQREVRRAGGNLLVSLSEADIRWLAGQRDCIQEDWLRPNEQTALRVGHLLSGLSLMVLERSGFRPVPLAEGLDRERVEKALYWYRQNLGQHPGVPDVARAVGVSSVHLRRIFRKIMNRSPKTAFQEIRMEQARELLEDRRLTVEAVAAEFGFSDASSFTRAYRRQFGHAPRR
jgi:AraC-like DNA-binding protein